MKNLALDSTSSHFITLSTNWTQEHLVLFEGVHRISNCRVKMANKRKQGLLKLWAYPTPTQNCKAVQSSCQATTIWLVVVISQSMNIDFKDLLARCSLELYCLIPLSLSFFCPEATRANRWFTCMLLCLRKCFWILHRKGRKNLSRRKESPKRRKPPYLLNHKSKCNLTAVGLSHGVFHVQLISQ